MSQRIYKVNNVIKKHLGDILVREISLKAGVFVTVTKVDTAPDFRYSDVMISIFPAKEEDYVLKTLGKEMYVIQGALNKLLQMNRLPHLRFHYDAGGERVSEIDALLREDEQAGKEEDQQADEREVSK